MTIIMRFTDHEPVTFTGDWKLCALQIANARLHSSFNTWEVA